MANIKIQMESGYERFASARRENVDKVGRFLIESYKANGKYSELLKRAGINSVTESLDITESSLYSTAIAGFIEARLRPKLVSLGLIKRISVPANGYDSIKVPIRSALITAVDLPDNGAFSYDTGTYGSETVTMRYSYAANRITHELSKFTPVDIIREELGEIGSALGRKQDSDIIAQFLASTTVGNANFNNLGSGNFLDYEELVDGLIASVNNFAEPSDLLVSPALFGRILKFNQVGGGSNITGALAFKGADDTLFPIPAQVLGMRLHWSQQVGANDVYYVDKERTGYLAGFDGVEVMDGRISGAAAYEIAGLLGYGIKIIQPKSLYRIRQDTA